jgi:hypothetical protein
MQRCLRYEFVDMQDKCDETGDRSFRSYAFQTFPGATWTSAIDLAYPLRTAPNRQSPDNSPINGYNRRPLSELASPYFVDWPDHLVPPKKPGEKSTPAFMPDPSSRICHDWS